MSLERTVKLYVAVFDHLEDFVLGSRRAGVRSDRGDQDAERWIRSWFRRHELIGARLVEELNDLGLPSHEMKVLLDLYGAD